MIMMYTIPTAFLNSHCQLVTVIPLNSVCKNYMMVCTSSELHCQKGCKISNHLLEN